MVYVRTLVDYTIAAMMALCGTDWGRHQENHPLTLDQ